MTNQNFPIGSIDWLNAMRRDFNLNGKLTVIAPTPVVFGSPATPLAEIHSEIGDVSNQARALRKRAQDLESRVAEIQDRLRQIKGG